MRCFASTQCKRGLHLGPAQPKHRPSHCHCPLALKMTQCSRHERFPAICVDRESGCSSPASNGRSPGLVSHWALCTPSPLQPYRRLVALIKQLLVHAFMLRLPHLWEQHAGAAAGPGRKCIVALPPHAARCCTAACACAQAAGPATQRAGPGDCRNNTCAASSRGSGPHPTSDSSR